MKLDEQEVKIVRELIRNPRSSDNKIAKNTGVPVMTVNRKRKALEKKGYLNYYTYLNTNEEGTGIFHARQLYVVTLRTGLTREEFIKSLDWTPGAHIKHSQYIVESYLGEKDGRLALILLLEAETEAQLVEIFNGEIITYLKERFGEDAIRKIITSRVTAPIRVFHNYLPLTNIENGKIKDDWLNEWIFVDRYMK